MIRGVIRGSLLLLFLALVACGQTLEEATGALARKVAARLERGEAARVSARSLAPAAAGDAARARSLLQSALRRPAVRNPVTVEVALTVSDNVRGPLLVAEIRRGSETFVEVAGYAAAASERTLRPALEKKLLWEQEDPILDVTFAEEQMLVLSAGGLRRCARAGGRWEVAEARPFPPVVRAVRDPRGRLEVSGNSLAVFLPGAACRGQWKPAVEVSCEEGAAEFTLDGERVRFSSGRNTLEAEGGDAVYSVAKSGGWRVAAALDGRIRVTGSASQRPFTLDGWGGDLAALAPACGAGARVLAASANDRDAADSVTAYEIAGQNLVAVSEPAQFPGPVTALWPASGGALAVVRNLTTGRYAAYSLTLDCGR